MFVGRVTEVASNYIQYYILAKLPMYIYIALNHDMIWFRYIYNQLDRGLEFISTQYTD